MFTSTHIANARAAAERSIRPIAQLGDTRVLGAMGQGFWGLLSSDDRRLSKPMLPKLAANAARPAGCRDTRIPV